MAATSIKAQKALLVATGLVLAVATLAALGWAIATLRVRPLDGVEGEALFEASRIRRGLPLYVDPVVGTTDVPPSRYYVLYPPLWPALLALVPEGVARVAGRALALASFVGAVLVAAHAPTRARTRALGPLSIVAAGFALSFFAVMLFGAAARPDSFALLLASLALARTLRRGALDVAAAVLFALAVLVKPNVLGLALGVFVLTAVSRPRAVVAPLVAGLAVGGVAAAVLHVLSGGAFLEHLLRSTGQSLSLALWGRQLALRLPFVAAPLAIAATFAWPVRDDARARLGLAALAAGTAWALFSLAKIGSASNYWMEPAIAAVALVAVAGELRAERKQFPAGRMATLALVLLFAQSIHNGVAAVKNANEDIPAAFAKHAALARASAECRTAPSDVVLADEPGLELETNGRLLGTPFQMAHLFAAGKLPRAPWLADLDRPEVRCVVTQRPELEGDAPWPADDRRFDPEIRAAITQRFARAHDGVDTGLWVYRRR